MQNNKRKISRIWKWYLAFIGAVSAAVFFSAAFFTADVTSKYVLSGEESITVRSLISGYTQAQGIFAEPLEKSEKRVFEEKAVDGFTFFLPAPIYGVYDLASCVYEFGLDIANTFSGKQ